jgi:hypothetical protein
LAHAVLFHLNVLTLQVLESALRCGLIGTVIDEQIWDIFGNQTDELTMMWQECLLQFVRTSTQQQTAQI